MMNLDPAAIQNLAPERRACAHAHVHKDGPGTRRCADCGQTWVLPPLMNEFMPRARCSAETLRKLEAVARAREERSTSDTLRGLIDEEHARIFGAEL